MGLSHHCCVSGTLLSAINPSIHLPTPPSLLVVGGVNYLMGDLEGEAKPGDLYCLSLGNQVPAGSTSPAGVCVGGAQRADRGLTSASISNSRMLTFQHSQPCFKIQQEKL